MQKVNQERAELNRKAQIEFHTAQEEERRLSEHRKKFLNSFLLPTTQMVGIFIRGISNNNDYITYYSTKIT
ncbi:MAG: hypothetical protein SP1CHLAM9_03990 [Chlamydiia bacterium]|nr:hypothetical protein [Chlamydiia bacterium]